MIRSEPGPSELAAGGGCRDIQESMTAYLPSGPGWAGVAQVHRRRRQVVLRPGRSLGIEISPAGSRQSAFCDGRRQATGQDA